MWREADKEVGNVSRYTYYALLRSETSANLCVVNNSEITSQVEVMQKMENKQQTSEIFSVYLLRANDQ